MKKLFYLAMAAGLSIVAISCSKEQKNAQNPKPVLPDVRQLNFINEVLVSGDSVVHISIDSNTAILHANGDTSFPAWYRKQNIEYARRAVNDNRGAAIEYVNVDTDSAQARKGPNGLYNLHYHVYNAYKEMNLYLYRDGVQWEYLGTRTDGVNNNVVQGNPQNVGFNYSLDCAHYYDLIVNTFKPDNTTPVTYASHQHLYVYGWQKLAGLGTAYGADMEITDIDNDGIPDLVGMISNRSSGSVNGISYKIFRDVSPNGTPASTTASVTKFLLTASSNAPTGGAIAIDNLNSNPRKDIIFVTYTSTGTGQPFAFRYIIGWDILDDGTATSWSGLTAPFTVTGVGNSGISDIGADIVDINHDGTKDLVLMAVDRTNRKMIYKVGFGLNSSGSADFSGAAKNFTVKYNTLYSSQGGGMDIGDLRGDGSLTMITSHYFSRFNNDYVDLTYSGDTIPPNPALTGAGSQTYTGYLYTSRETVGVDCRGAGISLGDMNNDQTTDLVEMSYVGDQFRFYVNYDLSYHYNTTFSTFQDCWINYSHGACTDFTY